MSTLGENKSSPLQACQDHPQFQPTFYTSDSVATKTEMSEHPLAWNQPKGLQEVNGLNYSLAVTTNKRT